MSVDEGPRRDSTAEALARLSPVFELPEGGDRGSATTGTVTAGNAPGITDGAAAVVVASERAVEAHGLKPMARIVGYAQAEVTPKWLFLAPVAGVRALEAKTGLAPADYDLVEINEAFAAQVLADGRELGFDWSKVNVNGGAIALGHPIGASGARIVATLVHELETTGRPIRPGDAVPGRRRVRGDGNRTGLTRLSTLSVGGRTRDPAEWTLAGSNAGACGHGTGDTPMIETTNAPEVEVRLSPAEIALVRTALKLLLSILGHDQADELAAVKALLERLPAA